MANANVVNVTAQTFNSEVLESNQPVLVDFWASWCGPCKQLAPVIDELAGDYQGKAKISKLELAGQEQEQLAADLGIRGIPALLFFKGGKEVHRIEGRVAKSAIASQLDALV